MKTVKKYLILFLDFFKIGLFTFGGGYAMISMISNELVEKRKYISAEEFSDVVAIAESTPGPIAINSATYIGYRVGGVIGSIVSSIAVSLPSFIIIYIISMVLPHFLDYAIVQNAFKGVQCAVVVLIITAAIKLIKNVKKNVLSIITICFSAIALFLVDLFSLNISTIYFIILGAIIGVIAYYPKMRKQDKIDKATAINKLNYEDTSTALNQEKDIKEVNSKESEK